MIYRVNKLFMKNFQKLVEWIYIPTQEKLAKDIGCGLVFGHIPDRYIPAVISCEMTKTWKRAGLAVKKGQNHFTIGKVVKGMSTRFDRTSTEYQSWLGGYTVKLANNLPWSVEDYCRLAVADQNSWLNWYGDPSPFTTIEGWKYKEICKLEISGYRGALYEGGFTTHSDVGLNHDSIRFRFAAHSMAALFNLANRNISLPASALVPITSEFPYERIDGRVYLGIFDIKPDVKVLLYGNGVCVSSQSSRIDTFEEMKSDFIKTMSACEITKTST